MPAEQPNILFVMTDQQAATMWSGAGNPWLSTPALDALAAGGMRFECAYATNPVCVPSRFSLQTGRMPSEIGMTHNQSPVTVPAPMLDQTLGRLLRTAGYRTAYAGKTHLPPPLEAQVRRSDYEFLTGDARAGCAAACVAFLKRSNREPWFLFASFVNPHDVCHMAINAHAAATGGHGHGNLDSASCEAVLHGARATGDLAAFVRAHAPPLPANFEAPTGEPDAVADGYLVASEFRGFVRRNWTETDWRLHRWLYARLTERVDAEIGRVLAQLEASGLAARTLVVFTSDHGDLDGAHRLEHKCIPYEEAARVPFAMRLPGAIPAGTVDAAHLVSNGLDLLPTLCDYAGAEVPDGLRGASLRPLAEGRPVRRWRTSLTVESQFGRMVRGRRYKYFRYELGARREMLVDLRRDPGEMTNLAANPDCRAELERHRRLAGLCPVRPVRHGALGRPRLRARVAGV